MRRLLWLALAGWWLAPGRCDAANEMPGYVVLALVQVGPHAAGVRGTIDGHPVTLIVDTGASHTTLDRKFYKGVLTPTTTPDSSLPAGFPKTARFNGMAADVGQIQNLQAGPMRFGNGPVIVMDLSVMSNSYRDYNHSHGDAPVAGLIGEDILTSYAAIIDWRRHGIYFNTDPSKRLKLGKGLTTSGWTAVPMERTNHRHFAVSSMIDGNPYQLLVDTGASFTTMDSGVLHGGQVIYNRGALVMRMIGSESIGRPLRLANWTLGDYHVPPVSVVSDQLPQNLLNETSPAKGPMAGLLGREVLARNSAIIDISGSTLYLKPATTR